MFMWVSLCLTSHQQLRAYGDGTMAKSLIWTDWPWDLVYSIGDVGPTRFAQMMNHAIFIWCVICKTTTVCKRISLVMGGKHFSKTVSIFYILKIAKTEFSTHIFNWYLSNEKNMFVDNLRVAPTILFMEKNIVIFETFLKPFLWAIIH